MLPISFASIVSLRKKLGHHWIKDRQQWWEERLEDLKQLSNREFAKKHRRAMVSVHYARAKALGMQRRPAGWWRTKSTLASLRSTKSHRAVAEELGISMMMVRRIREQLRMEITQG